MGPQVGAWQPNGRHLYVAQQTPSGPRVLLFETNGLQHGGFDVGPSGVHHQAVAGSSMQLQCSAPRKLTYVRCTMMEAGITAYYFRRTMS